MDFVVFKIFDQNKGERRTERDIDIDGEAEKTETQDRQREIMMGGS